VVEAYRISLHLARGDYFGTSVKITEADICMFVGGISEIRHYFLPLIAY
jgi:hypothetical protein